MLIAFYVSAIAKAVFMVILRCGALRCGALRYANTPYNFWLSAIANQAQQVFLPPNT
ncbi:MAG: hypothetical protein F6K41_21255 [Symploca sp. SIO3E6]|nr:hypothetical protein [Caldora sp. SIO3E6]